MSHYLQKLGELEGMREWIRKIKEYEESRALELYDDKNGENNENLPDFHELKKASEAPITGDPTLARSKYFQGLSQDPSYLSFGQVLSKKKTPVWTGKNFYDDFSILTFLGGITKYFPNKPSWT